MEQEALRNLRERARSIPPGQKLEVDRNDVIWLVLQAEKTRQGEMFGGENPKPDFSHVPTNKTATSQKAAAKVAPRFGTHAHSLAKAIASTPNGMIREQACLRTGILMQSACGALNILEDQGFVETAGERPNSLGNDCQIYHITEKGRAWLKKSAK